MKRRIGSSPGAVIFRSIAALIIVLILISYFFVYTARIDKGVRQAAKQQVLNDINSALALTLYQMAIDRQLGKLPMLEGANPFVYLAIYRSMPADYHGTVHDIHEVREAGWYFDLSSNQVIYSTEAGNLELYRQKIDYLDKNSSSEFEYQVDKIVGLKLKRLLKEPF